MAEERDQRTGLAFFICIISKIFFSVSYIVSVESLALPKVWVFYPFLHVQLSSMLM